MNVKRIQFELQEHERRAEELRITREKVSKSAANTHNPYINFPRSNQKERINE